MKVTRSKTSKADALIVAARINALEHEIQSIVCGTKVLTLAAADRLASIHRQLRTMKGMIEVECGIDHARQRPGPS